MRKGLGLFVRFARFRTAFPGPVRGFRKLRRAQWIKLRRVEE